MDILINLLGSNQFITFIFFAIIIIDSFSSFILNKYTYFLGIPIIKVYYEKKIKIPEINKINTTTNLKYKFIDDRFCIFRIKYDFFFSKSPRYLLKGNLKIHPNKAEFIGKLPISFILLIPIFIFYPIYLFHDIFSVIFVGFSAIILISIILAGIYHFKKAANELILDLQV